MPTPFDDLFHYVFQHVWHAQQLLRCLLPPVLVGAIDWVTLRGATEKVHDETLRQRVTDVLFAVDLVRGGSLWLLLEHKSHLDPDLHRQLLRYSVRLHDLPPGPGDDLPVGVLPIVVHHGEPGAAPAARPTTAAERAIAALQPDVPFVLDDLRSSDEDRLRERGLTALATLTLLCLAHLRSAGPAETLASLHRWSDLLRAADGDPHPPGGAQAVRAIPMFFHLGAHDDNDAVPYTDSFPEAVAEHVWALFGETPVARWDDAERLFAGYDAEFRLYADLGHEAPKSVRREVIAFLAEHDDRSACAN